MRSLRFFAFGLVLTVALPALAKPLYVTVPRTYGTSEDIGIDVAFAGREPVELRVLSPEDPEAFIRGQANLRRAWNEPPVLVNPGRYLARGLNAMESPGRWWRKAFSMQARETVSSSLPPAKNVESVKPRLAESPARLVGTPAGMKVVHSQWLNLDLGGMKEDFHVPGFEEWTGFQFEERRVTLRPLPAGIYVLQLVQGRVEGQVTLVVTDLTMQVKQTDGLVLVRVAGRDGVARKGVKVSVFGESNANGTTDEKGEAWLEAKAPKLLVSALLGNDRALVDTDFYSTLAMTPDVFVYSDRPIYKPGDEVGFRGIVRQPDSFLSRLFQPKNRRVTVTLAPGVSTTAQVDAYGSFHGSLMVPEKLEPGVVRLVATLDGATHQAEARVQEYVKPTYFLEVMPDSEVLSPGGTLTATVRARRFAGGVPKNTKYEYFLYRTLLESPSWVDDAGLGGEGSKVTYGSQSTTEGMLSVQHRLFSSTTERLGSWFDEDPWKTAASFDENGEARIEFKVPALEPGDEELPWRYSITVRAKDDQDVIVNGGASLYLSKVQVLGALSSPARLVRTGAEAGLSVKSLTLSGRAYGSSKGQVSFRLLSADGTEKLLSETPFETSEEGIWRGRWPSSEIGSVVAKVTLQDGSGGVWSGEETLLVAGQGTEAVAAVPALTLETVSQVYEPGESAQIVALLPEGWSAAGTSSGSLWVTTSGTGIHSTERVDFSGRTFVHSFPIEKKYGSAVHVSIAHPTPTGRWEERSTGLRIVPKERTLTVFLEPRRAEVKPLGVQEVDLRVVDHRGKGVVAQVSVGVVDKAIYSLQSEFRPNVIDFFYPIVRNNVATFYSAEFQGYGYGEVLARLRKSLAPYEFAAIKPPARKADGRERDTAYWNPSIVTDRDGRATLRFSMPSNQTLWVATAVAADASGRFGEGTAEFASRGQMALAAALPQFLREGDTASASVRLARAELAGEPKAKQLKIALMASGSIEGSQEAEVGLEAGGEQVVPVLLSAKKAGSGEFSTRISGDETASETRRVPVRPATVEETYASSAWQGGALSLAVPAGAAVAEATLSLRPTSVDTALSTIRGLMTYPYGCLEQLVATTIPNVAVYRTLEEAGALAKLDPGSMALLEEARSRAVLGVARILDLGVRGGGFTWFDGYSTPSPALTLIALDGLAYGVEAGLVSRSDRRISESVQWVSGLELPEDLDALRAYVLARLDRNKAAPHVRAFIERMPRGDLYLTSMALLAARTAGIDAEPALGRELESRAAEVKPQLATLAVWTPPGERFRDLPLRRTALTAIASHALLQDRKDIDTARRLFVESLSEEGLSTYDRSTALLHGLWLLKADASSLKKSAPPVVTAGGQPLKLTPAGFGFEAQLDPSTRTLDVARFEGVASVTARLVRPYASVESTSEGLSIERAYFVLRGDTRVRLEPGMSVHPGEEVYVQLSIDTKADEKTRALRSAYTVVEDLVPAGFVALDEDKQFRGEPYFLEISHESLRKRVIDVERVTLFLEEPAFWSRSPRVVGYVMRAQFPGRFAAPPASIEDMYASSLRGRSAPDTLEVAKAP